MDMTILSFLAAPFVASLVIAGIHAYLGVHVVERGVIFVDLSLAQIAALGTTIAVLAGIEPHGDAAYIVSLAFTLVGAAVFSTIRGHKVRIPQEAVIGITYAVASAAAILAMSKSMEQTEHLKEMLVGNILSVSWAEVRTTAIVYGCIGLFHYIFRKRFLAISLDHGHSGSHGYSVRFWDFLFYASFGFVVTSSVSIAGVLLVFSFLIVPPIIGLFFSRKLHFALPIAWIFGIVASAVGLAGSYAFDLPTGAAMVTAFVSLETRHEIAHAVDLLLERGIKAIGSDTPSPEVFGVPGDQVHHKVLDRGVAIVENLTNLDQVAPLCFLVALRLGRGQRENRGDEDRHHGQPDHERDERVAAASLHHVLYSDPSREACFEPLFTSMMPGGSAEAVSDESGSSMTTCHVSADFVNGSIGILRMYFSVTRVWSASG